MAPYILNLGTRIKRVFSFTPHLLYGARWIGKCEGPRAGLDAVKETPYPYRELNHSQPALSHCTD
jgi:hypothetical protein